MNDFTKIKLTNSLIELVENFYELKDSAQEDELLHSKGFCEGMSYSLVELGIISQKESIKILKGLGSKKDLPVETKNEIQEDIVHSKKIDQVDKVEKNFEFNKTYSPSEELDIPTFKRR